MKPILEVNNLQIAFQTKAGRLQAIRGVDFTLEKGRTWRLWERAAVENP